MKDAVIEYEILNWEKYNPRTDARTKSWFRVNADLMQSSSIAQLDHKQFRIWFALLARSCKGSGKAVLTMKSITAEAQTKQCVITDALELLQSLEMIRYEIRSPAKLLPLRTKRTIRTEQNEQLRPVSDAVQLPTPSYTPKHQKNRKPISLAERPENSQVWICYSEAYRKRYGQDPARNAKNYGICRQLVERVGLEQAKQLVQFYLQHNSSWYVQKCHMLQFCLGDAEALLTQMQANFKVTSSFAQQQDRSQNNQQVFQEVLELWNAKEEAQDDAAGT